MALVRGAIKCNSAPIFWKVNLINGSSKHCPDHTMMT